MSSETIRAAPRRPCEGQGGGPRWGEGFRGRLLMPGALAGVRVVDFGHYIAGPLAAVMLADQGADVVHVDPPGGPRWKSDADAFLNRGKRRISLDLKQSDDLAIGAAPRGPRRRRDRELPARRDGAARAGPGCRPRSATRGSITCSLPGLRRRRPASRHAGLGRDRRRGDRQLPRAGRRGAAGLGHVPADLLRDPAGLQLRGVPGGHQRGDGADRPAPDRQGAAHRDPAVPRHVHRDRAGRRLRHREGPPRADARST